MLLPPTREPITIKTRHDNVCVGLLGLCVSTSVNVDTEIVCECQRSVLKVMYRCSALFLRYDILN